jgi:hypothetical protein
VPPRTCAICGTELDAEYLGGRCERCLGNQLWQPMMQWQSSFARGGLISWDEEKPKTARVDDQFDTDRAPDLIEPILAWRGWEVTPGGHLTASAVSGVWDPGVNRAVCRNAHHTDDVPAVGCSCGFYAWHEPQDIAHGQVRGAIKCWGEIIVHDVGVRAEYAEVICLFAGTAPDVFLQRAAEKYGVPIVADQAAAEKLAAPLGIRVPTEMRPEKPDPREMPYDSMTAAMKQMTATLQKYSYRHGASAAPAKSNRLSILKWWS